jgi:hypothetical protein
MTPEEQAIRDKREALRKILVLLLGLAFAAYYLAR